MQVLSMIRRFELDVCDNDDYVKATDFVIKNYVSGIVVGVPCYEKYVVHKAYKNGKYRTILSVDNPHGSIKATLLNLPQPALSIIDGYEISFTNGAKFSKRGILEELKWVNDLLGNNLPISVTVHAFTYANYTDVLDAVNTLKLKPNCVRVDSNNLIDKKISITERDKIVSTIRGLGFNCPIKMTTNMDNEVLEHYSGDKGVSFGVGYNRLLSMIGTVENDAIVGAPGVTGPTGA